MKKFIFLTALALGSSVNIFGHQAFTLVSSERKTIRQADLAQLEKEQTAGKKSKTVLTFTENEIRLMVFTGPEDDMLSYRIQGLRNPTLIVPTGATLKILFVNIDDDMHHDLRFGHVVGEFPTAPDIKETAGSEKLASKAEDGTIQADEFVIKANEDGVYKYFCSVRTHAKGGMWGNIAVGVKPGANMKMPVKTTHVHSPDEDKPAEKKPDDMSASAIYNKKFDEGHDLASTFVWGQNYGNGERTNSYLFESNYDFDKNAIFGRIENVQKSGHDLVLDPVDEHHIFTVGSYSIGYIRDLVRGKGVDVGLGAMATLDINPQALVPYYGGTAHGGWQIFMRFRPSRHD